MIRRFDVHTHAFPDALADRAVASLEKRSGEKAFLNGTLDALRGSMRRAGITHSVVASIATRPEQFEPILAWSRAIRADDILPFPSVHPADPRACDHIRRIHDEGFKGIKLHPYYQDFDLDAPALFPLYKTVSEAGLALLAHTGFDVAFPRIRRCDPPRIIRILDAFPELKLVTTHCGGWEDWDRVEAHMLGKPIYMDIAYVNGMDRARFRHFLQTHDPEYLLFGTDSPWADQAQAVQEAEDAVSDPHRRRHLFWANAARLLGLEGARTGGI